MHACMHACLQFSSDMSASTHHAPHPRVCLSCSLMFVAMTMPVFLCEGLGSRVRINYCKIQYLWSVKPQATSCSFEKDHCSLFCRPFLGLAGTSKSHNCILVLQLTLWAERSLCADIHDCCTSLQVARAVQQLY